MRRVSISPSKEALLSALAMVWLVVSSPLHAQKVGQERLDSLRGVLAAATDGRDLVDAMNDLSKYGGLLIGELDTALHYATAAKNLAEKTGYRKGLGDAHHNLGYYNNSAGHYDAALDEYGKALSIYLDIGHEQGAARTYNTLGNVNADIGNLPEALTNYFTALKLFEKLGDRRGIGNAYNNRGLIYAQQGQFDDALNSYTEALRVYEETGFDHGVGNTCTNIGNLYLNINDLDEALRNYRKSLEINERTGNKTGVAMLYSNMALIEQDRGDHEAAMKNLQAALKLFEAMGHGPGMANSYGALGSLQLAQGNATEGRRWLTKALAAAKDMGDHAMIRSSYRDLAKADSALSDFRNAFLHYKLYVLYRDSLINEENTRKTVQLQMQYEFDKKEAESLAEQDKKDALTRAEIRKQKVIRNSVGAVMLIVVAFSAVVYRQRNKIGREKRRSEELLLNILPEAVAEELKAKGEAEARMIDQVTVLFSDFKGFTVVSEQISARELVKDLNECFSAFDRIMEKHGMEKIKTIGDAYMAAGGLPTPNGTHASDAIKAAMEMRDFIEAGKAAKIAQGLPYFEIRIGIHTGPVVAGIVGVKKFQYDIWGDTVNTASRMESSGEAGMINVSAATHELVKDKFIFTHRGKVVAKGKGELDMYFVDGPMAA